ncbi:transporter substrate-binding domain-containing protein [Pseudoalteromonas tunicata]|uniref:substrate-binding periplasmic protein n=1 Tax=Pseudoalteromonas tunicata TaxID=314281 RepID=UPI0027401D4C|nr:transporter substrate-binding domain-containing protein [Pseudoalteromonas tunicata]MDP5213654.1 transporter substrate-binding domain-containing protein [Pseudoalteromonas tunicata]
MYKGITYGLFCLLCHASFAATIKVVAEHLPPYQIKNNDRIDGFAIDVLNELTLITGIKSDLEIVPWARAYHIASTEKNTLILSISRTDTREKFFHWIGTLSNEPVFVWALTETPTQHILSFSQLKNEPIAVSQESYIEQSLTYQHFTKLERLASSEQYIGMLFKKRAKFIISTETALRLQLNTLDLSYDKVKKVLKADSFTENLSLAFNLQSDAELVKRYQEAYAILQASGKITELKTKWHLDLE